MFELVCDSVFPFIKFLNSENKTFVQHMKDAIFVISTPALIDRGSSYYFLLLARILQKNWFSCIKTKHFYTYHWQCV